MAARIFRRLKAANDAENIADYIAGSSLESAIRFLECTEATLMVLADAPLSGSRFESDHPALTNIRFRRIKGFSNHVIFYIAREQSIEVVRILHGAQDLAAELTK